VCWRLRLRLSVVLSLSVVFEFGVSLPRRNRRVRVRVRVSVCVPARYGVLRESVVSSVSVSQTQLCVCACVGTYVRVVVQVGHGVRAQSSAEYAPVFVQFLDCTWQLLNMYVRDGEGWWWWRRWWR
jgi:hypothetical protein